MIVINIEPAPDRRKQDRKDDQRESVSLWPIGKEAAHHRDGCKRQEYDRTGADFKTHG